MDSKNLLKHLESLVQVDVDAMHCYTSAIDRIDLPEVKEQLVQFRSDHERHISDLASFIERLGGRPSMRVLDLRGAFLQGMTAIRSMIGTESALRAMRDNEEAINKSYDMTVEQDLPRNVKRVIQMNRQDERRHLEYVNKCIMERVWEKHEKTAA